ncbi:MAG: S1 family peptidase [Oligoflexus sp.]
MNRQNRKLFVLFTCFSWLFSACSEPPQKYTRSTAQSAVPAIDQESSNQDDGDDLISDESESDLNEEDMLSAGEPPVSDPCGAASAFGYLYKGQSGSSIAIVGGRQANSNDLVYRSTVKIHLGQGHCTGTLIGPNQIVSASHCFFDQNDQRINSLAGIQIGFGENGTPDPNLQVTGVVTHPRYIGLPANENGFLQQVLYDVAVLTFDGELAPAYYPVVIGSSTTELASGSPVQVAGYGAYSENDNLIRPLSIVETTVAEILTNLREIQLTVGEQKGACYGDSGGPTYIHNAQESCLKVMGATTGPGRQSNGTCDVGSGTMMDITSYKGWIKCSVNALGKPLSYLLDDGSEVDCNANSLVQ